MSDTPNYSRAANKINVNIEHVWPKSRFNNYNKDLRESQPNFHYQVSDLHHLIPASKNINSKRESLEYAEVSLYGSGLSSGILKRLNFGLNNNKIGRAVTDSKNSNTLYFEPIDEYKGRIARALMYFSIRYRLPMSETQEFFARKWHLEFPPTQAERDYNDAIYKIQFNRNPFIDHPKLTNYILDFREF